MIGVLLHLAALAPAAVATHVASAALSLLGRGTPDPSEVEQLGAEVDALRDERDKARAQLADARTLAHEAKLEFSAAREACEQLRGELADWRGIAASEQREAAEVRAQLEELRALMRKFLIVREAYMSCDPGALADYNACLADMRAAVEEVKP